MLDITSAIVIGSGLITCMAIGVYTLCEITWHVITPKCLALRCVTLYLCIGLLLGYAMKLALPAISWLGFLYYALIWPAFVSAGTFHTPAPPIPDWCFYFKD